METSGFWSGVIVTSLVGIPVAILANLFTPKISKLLDNTYKNRKVKKTKNIRAEYEEIKNYKENEDKLNMYFISVIIQCTLLGSISSIFSAIFYSAASLSHVLKILLYDKTEVLYIVGYIYTVLVALVIVNICNRAMKIYSKVKNFDDYEVEVKNILEL